MKEGEFPGIPQPGFICQFLRVPGKDSVYCPGSVFFCSDTQIEIIIIIISLQQLLLSEELHIKPTAVESSRPSPALAHAESLWLSHLSPGPLSSVLRSEQKPPVPSQSPVSPKDQPFSRSPVSTPYLKTVPSHLPAGACSRAHTACLQGLTGAPWCLLSAVSLSL